MQRKIDFGDFQTPVELARKVCFLVKEQGFQPASVLEPTCGTGAFIQACAETFSHVKKIVGADINPLHLKKARARMEKFAPLGTELEFIHTDFFLFDWEKLVNRLPKPVLVVGNPPWVTNAKLGSRGSRNLPPKTNADGLVGLEAIMGNSNFDISEWMVRRLLEVLHNEGGLLAVLIKASVARKILAYAWKRGLAVSSASFYSIDAQKHFGASVSAGLLLIQFSQEPKTHECKVYSALNDVRPSRSFAYIEGELVADLDLFNKHKHLRAKKKSSKLWRSGIKHDNAKLYEFRIVGQKWVNGFGETVDLEPDVLFPLLKSSDLARKIAPQKWVLVPNRSLGEDTRQLRKQAPMAWDYLVRHAAMLEKRKSAVHKKSSPFSVFGVGEYTFSPWKIAISALHKKLEFVIVPPFQGKPVVLDDTSYFLPCGSEKTCFKLYSLLNSRVAREFYSAFIFWDDKRPIKAKILNKLDLGALERELRAAEAMEVSAV